MPRWAMSLVIIFAIGSVQSADIKEQLTQSLAVANQAVLLEQTARSLCDPLVFSEVDAEHVVLAISLHTAALANGSIEAGAHLILLQRSGHSADGNFAQIDVTIRELAARAHPEACFALWLINEQGRPPTVLATLAPDANQAKLLGIAIRGRYSSALFVHAQQQEDLELRLYFYKQAEHAGSLQAGLALAKYKKSSTASPLSGAPSPIKVVTRA